MNGKKLHWEISIVPGNGGKPMTYKIPAYSCYINIIQDNTFLYASYLWSKLTFTRAKYNERQTNRLYDTSKSRL